MEDLVKFSIKTVADKMVEEGVMVSSVSQKKGLFALRKVCDPLLATAAFPQISKKAHPSQTKKQQASEMTTVDRPAKNDRRGSRDLESDSLMQDSILRTLSKESAEPAASAAKEYLPSIKESTQDLAGESSRRKSVEAYTQEAILLDENDPIRKLQKYFGPGHAAYDDGGDGHSAPQSRLGSRKWRAPKHRNYIMQRYENRRRIKGELKARAQSQLAHGPSDADQSMELTLSVSAQGSALGTREDPSLLSRPGHSLQQLGGDGLTPSQQSLQQLGQDYMSQLDYLSRIGTDG